MIENLATERVKKLTPYMSARRIGGKGHVFLNANEAPKSSIFIMNSTSFNRYPECQPPQVLEAYADYSGVPEENILVSRGSDESIGLLVRTFCEPGKDAILISSPTYGMYSISADTAGVRTVDVPPRDDFQPDLEAIKKAFAETSEQIKIIFICSPNNPTGNVVDRELLKQILDAVKEQAAAARDALKDAANAIHGLNRSLGDEAYKGMKAMADKAAEVAADMAEVVTRAVPAVFTDRDGNRIKG